MRNSLDERDTYRATPESPLGRFPCKTAPLRAAPLCLEPPHRPKDRYAKLVSRNQTCLKEHPVQTLPFDDSSPIPRAPTPLSTECSGHSIRKAVAVHRKSLWSVEIGATDADCLKLGTASSKAWRMLRVGLSAVGHMQCNDAHVTFQRPYCEKMIRKLFDVQCTTHTKAAQGAQMVALQVLNLVLATMLLCRNLLASCDEPTAVDNDHLLHMNPNSLSVVRLCCMQYQLHGLVDHITSAIPTMNCVRWFTPVQSSEFSSSPMQLLAFRQKCSKELFFLARAHPLHRSCPLIPFIDTRSGSCRKFGADAT
eukprot:1558582-Amphidinium_carterae.1